MGRRVRLILRRTSGRLGSSCVGCFGSFCVGRFGSSCAGCFGSAEDGLPHLAEDFFPHPAENSLAHPVENVLTHPAEVALAHLHTEDASARFLKRVPARPWRGRAGAVISLLLRLIISVDVFLSFTARTASLRSAVPRLSLKTLTSIRAFHVRCEPNMCYLSCFHFPEISPLSLNSRGT